ncbi:MAG: hypothetical protein K2I93_03950 [Oscillospiraceae bacterium]|nr:hypothetical protein [Oscillospiraceae bacterium]
MSTEIIVSDEYIKATELHKRFKANMHSAVMSIVDAGKCLSEMKKDKLYKQFGYQNFDDYCENEAKIGRDQAYKMIRIVENLPEDFVESTRQIGIEKLATLALLPFEQVQEVVENVDVETVTVKELKAHIKELETENAENEHAAELLSVELGEAKHSLEKKDKQFKAAMESKQNEIDDLRAGAKKRTDMLITKIQKLQTELEEAKQKPDAVTVEDVSRIEELTQELADCREQLRQAQQELAEKPMVQEALPVTADHLGEFRAYYAAVLDDLKRLFGFAQSHSHSANMPLFLDKISNIVNMSETELEKLKGESSCP